MKYRRSAAPKKIGRTRPAREALAADARRPLRERRTARKLCAQRGEAFSVCDRSRNARSHLHVDREGLAGRIPRGAARVAGRRRGFSAPAGDATNARSNVIRACASRSIAGVASFDPYTVESSRLWSSDRNTTILGTGLLAGAADLLRIGARLPGSRTGTLAEVDARGLAVLFPLNLLSQHSASSLAGGASCCSVARG
jgi:hypothetical protein